MEKDIESFYQIRQQLGTASYLIIISLILLILSEKYSIEIFPKRIRNGLLVYFTAISILALSRTFLLVFIVLLICGLGLLSFNKYFIRNILVIICTVLIGWWSLSRIDGMEPYSFIGKLQSSLDEVTIQDYNPKQEIIYSWRGVEAYKGMQEFKAGSLIEKVVGHGFGKSADIGFEMTLDGKVFTSISKFHNGYISILLKTGILGVIVYFLFFFQMVWNSLKQDNKANLHSRFINNMIVGISIVYLLTTIVIAGWLNTGSFIIFSFLLGYFLKLKKKQNNTFELSDIKISS
ncbi:MAG TPA: hypothetical protein VFM70_11130 [Salinimicrobium sp.]|nr:hypothetical protein [Salinimicrobium sp.]